MTMKVDLANGRQKQKKSHDVYHDYPYASTMFLKHKKRHGKFKRNSTDIANGTLTTSGYFVPIRKRRYISDEE